MLDTTAAKAAELLGVSRARALQLVRSGALDAEKVDSIWLVDGSLIAIAS